MIIAKTLALIWTLGVGYFTYRTGVYLWSHGDVVDYGFAFLMSPVVFILATLPWAFIAHEESPDLETLKKDEWVCTRTKTETYMALVGKVMVPQTRKVCTRYERIER